MRAGLLTIAVVACLATGCTSAHHAVTSPSPTPSSTTAVATPTKTPTPTPSQPTVPADVPTTGPNLNHPGEKPPVMPLLATQHTPAGAVAFGIFFIKTIDWGYAATTSSYMNHYTAPTCIGCKSFRLGLDHARKMHRHFVGDRFRQVTAKATQNLRAGAERTVTATFEVDSSETLDSRGGYVGAYPAIPRAIEIMSLAWEREGWVVIELVPQ